MKDTRRARALARALVDGAARAGRPSVALLTDMNVPIGRTIGNALETREAIELLQNGGPPDARELTLRLGVEMLLLAGRAKTAASARGLLERALADGSAFERFLAMVRAHGGKTSAVEHPERLARARFGRPVLAPRTGVVVATDPLELGFVAVALGAGRARADDPVDHGAGIELLRVVGERVERGEPLAVLHASKRSLLDAAAPRAERAFAVGARSPRRELVLGRITSRG
jgi:thymidine phosphorylase